LSAKEKKSSLIRKKQGAHDRQNGGRICRKKVYPSELKSWEFSQKAAQIFVSGASYPCLWQGASEDQKFAAKLTPPKTNF